MKKSILLGVLGVLSFSGFSQDRMYVSFNTGYALATTKDAIGITSNTYSNGDFKTANIYGSFGVGIPFTLRGGMKINDNLAAELGASYLLGSTVTTEEITAPSSASKTKVKTTQIRVLPSLVFSGKNEALHFYGRCGLVLPVGGKSKLEKVTTGPDIGGNTTETIFKEEQTNKFSIGYFGAVGVSVKVADNMQAFCEVEHVSLNAKQKTKILTEFSVNGADQLGTLAIQQKEIVYIDEITSSENTKIDEPLKMRPEAINFSSVGLNFGIKFFF